LVFVSSWASPTIAINLTSSPQGQVQKIAFMSSFGGMPPIGDFPPPWVSASAHRYRPGPALRRSKEIEKVDDTVFGWSIRSRALW
jgi:hypothetical protein